jgi:hypothetical protein
MGVSGELQVPGALPSGQVIPVRTEQNASRTQRRPKSLATAVCVTMHSPKPGCQTAKQQIALCITPLVCFVSQNPGQTMKVEENG